MEKHLLTAQGLKELQDELEHIIKVDKPKNEEDLAAARAQGDLSENADYDAARDAQARIEARKKEIEAILKNYEIIDGGSKSNLGKLVTIYFEDTKETEEYKIVGSIESDPLNGLISNESIIGSKLLRAAVGDKILIKTESDTFNIVVKNIKDDPKQNKK